MSRSPRPRCGFPPIQPTSLILRLEGGERSPVFAREPGGLEGARRLAMPDGEDVPAAEEPLTSQESSLRRALGASYCAIAQLGEAASEVVPVALESVIGQG